MMKSDVRQWATDHAGVLKVVFYTLLAIGVAVAAKTQLSSLNGKLMQTALHSLSPLVIFGVIVAGLAAFSLTGLYDIIGARYAGATMSRTAALGIGWQAQALNNFVGLGGLTGGTVRTHAYRRHGVDTPTALRITLSVWISNLIGLCALIIVSAPVAVHVEHAYAFIPVAVALCALALYIFGHKIHIGPFHGDKTPLGYLPIRGKLLMVGASVLDWLGAALFFALCIVLFVPDAHLGTIIFVYSTATVVGLISFIPSGLGTFDMTVIALMAGSNVNLVLLAIITYRVVYYLIPWVLASVYMLVETWDRHFTFEVYSRGGQALCNILAAGMVIVGTLLILSSLTPEVVDRVHIIHEFIPTVVVNSSRFSTLLVGILLILLSKGIVGRVRRVYVLTVFLLGLTVITVMLKGLDYEEAIILLVFGALLLLSGKYFTAEPIHLGARSIAWTTLVLIGIPLLIYMIRTETNLLPIRTPLPHTPNAAGHFLVVTVVLVTIAMVAMFTAAPEVHRKPLTSDDVNTFDQIIEKFGGNAYSHLFYLYDKSVFFNEKRTVAFLYYPVKNNMLILGDPVGCADDISGALDELLTYCSKNRYNVAFYEASGKLLEEYWDRGFQVVKIGEDATLDLSTVSFTGNKGKKFRRMLNRIKDKDMSFEMWYPPLSPHAISQLRQVSYAWLGNREEMGYSLGFFSPDYIGRTPVAVMKSGKRIEGFATIQPIDGRAISIDLMRFRPDAPGGVMDGIFASLFSWAKDAGFSHFYLGMAPMVNDQTKIRWRQSDKVVRYIFWLGKGLYSFSGLREYKDKFHPQWRSRYLVYTSHRRLPGTISGLLEAVRTPAEIRYVEGAPTQPIGPIGRGESRATISVVSD